MRSLIQAIVSSLAHYGHELHTQTLDVACLADTLGHPIDSDHVQEVVRLYDEIRQGLGVVHIQARQLNNLLKYGANENE